MTKQLKSIDIVISIFNQEKIIERILKGVCENTITPFNLILVFDGCVDRTKPLALNWLKEHRPKNMLELRTEDAPDVYELKATNIGFRLGTEDYIITMQDDMEIKEKGWEVRLTYPIRKYDDIFSVSAYLAHNFGEFTPERQVYKDQVARKNFNLPRKIFAIRDIVMRSPVAYDAKKLRELNFFNEDYAPCTLDEADAGLRAWERWKLKSGVFWIDYLSKPSWSKSKSKDSTMNEGGSRVKNVVRLKSDHEVYFKLESGTLTEDRVIPDSEIDYPESFDRFSRNRKLFISNVAFAFHWLSNKLGRIWRKIIRKTLGLINLLGKVLKI